MKDFNLKETTNIRNVLISITSEYVIRGTIFNALFLSTFVAKNDVLNEHHKN
jgi:hypothetical protein